MKYPNQMEIKRVKMINDSHILIITTENEIRIWNSTLNIPKCDKDNVNTC